MIFDSKKRGRFFFKNQSLQLFYIDYYLDSYKRYCCSTAAAAAAATAATITVKQFQLFITIKTIMEKSPCLQITVQIDIFKVTVVAITVNNLQSTCLYIYHSQKNDKEISRLQKHHIKR